MAQNPLHVGNEDPLLDDDAVGHAGVVFSRL